MVNNTPQKEDCTSLDVNASRVVKVSLYVAITDLGRQCRIVKVDPVLRIRSRVSPDVTEGCCKTKVDAKEFQYAH